jgi:hypothetical protein
LNPARRAAPGHLGVGVGGGSDSESHGRSGPTVRTRGTVTIRDRDRDLVGPEPEGCFWTRRACQGQISHCEHRDYDRLGSACSKSQPPGTGRACQCQPEWPGRSMLCPSQHCAFRAPAGAGTTPAGEHVPSAGPESHAAPRPGPRRRVLSVTVGRLRIRCNHEFRNNN